MKPIRIGLIGCGGIANGVHLPQLSEEDGVTITALCDINPEALKRTAEKYGVPSERQFSDYKALIAREDVDAVDICTPNYLHCPMAMEAVSARKPFSVEKPVGINVEEVEALYKAASAAGIPAMVCFSYRFMPAVRYARKYVEDGKLGKINSVYVQYLKDSAFIEGRRLDWRFVKEYARYGVSGDLGVHLLDLSTFLAGPVTRVCADLQTVVPWRKRLDSEELAPVETDDTCNFLAEYSGGAIGTFGITRCAIGHKNTISMEIYGDKGALRFNLNHNDRLWMLEDGAFAEHAVPEEYFAHSVQMREFIRMLRGEKDPFTPGLEEGLSCQRVLDAIMESAEKRVWANI